MNKLGQELFEKWLILKKADILVHKLNEDRLIELDKIKCNYKEIINDINECVTTDKLAINGNDVMRLLNIKPSKLVGEVLDKMLDAVMEERVTNSREELEKFLKEAVLNREE